MDLNSKDIKHRSMRCLVDDASDCERPLALPTRRDSGKNAEEWEPPPKRSSVLSMLSSSSSSLPFYSPSQKSTRSVISETTVKVSNVRYPRHDPGKRKNIVKQESSNIKKEKVSSVFGNYKVEHCYKFPSIKESSPRPTPFLMEQEKQKRMSDETRTTQATHPARQTSTSHPGAFRVNVIDESPQSVTGQNSHRHPPPSSPHPPSNRTTTEQTQQQQQQQQQDDVYSNTIATESSSSLNSLPPLHQVRLRPDAFRDEDNYLIEATLVEDNNNINNDCEMPSSSHSDDEDELFDNPPTTDAIHIAQAKPVRNRYPRAICCGVILLIVGLIGVIVGAIGGMQMTNMGHQQDDVVVVPTSTPQPPSMAPPIEIFPPLTNNNTLEHPIPTTTTTTTTTTSTTTTTTTTATTTTTTPPPITTTAPTPIATLDFLQDVLPQYIRQTILDNPRSTPSRAYHWIHNEPQFLNNTYTTERKLQRFALALLFYALSGESWTKSDRWISHDHHECDWYSDEYIGRICISHETYQTLHLFSANISGNLPDEISLLSSLIKMDFSDNRLSGTLPSAIANLSNLQHLDFYKNALTGPLPSELTQLSNMKYLDFDYNQLSQIPEDLFRLEKLEIVSFAGNRLTGTLSANGLANWSSKNRLKYLSFGTNRLEGTLPSEIGLLLQATVVDFSNNYIEGSLPSQLGELGTVRYLFLEGNRLTGQIPSDLGRLTNLEKLWIHNNLLSGSVPDELCQLVENGSLDELVVDCTTVDCFCDCHCQTDN